MLYISSDSNHSMLSIHFINLSMQIYDEKRLVIAKSVSQFLPSLYSYSYKTVLVVDIFYIELQDQ